jgi:hypothetical protein
MNTNEHKLNEQWAPMNSHELLWTSKPMQLINTFCSVGFACLAVKYVLIGRVSLPKSVSWFRWVREGTCGAWFWGIERHPELVSFVFGVLSCAGLAPRKLSIAIVAKHDFVIYCFLTSAFLFPCCVGLPHPKYLYWNVQIHLSSLSTKRFTLAQTDSLQTHIYPE